MIEWLLSILVWLGIIAKPRFVVRYSETHPGVNALADRDLVIVRSDGNIKWACLKCPCGCGEKIALSLAPERRPRWSVDIDFLRRPTVSPSVNQRDGCYAHFWIREGNVEWCAGSGQRQQGHSHDIFA